MQAFRLTVVLSLLVAGLSVSERSNALSVDELLGACAQIGAPCKDIPWVQAYIGGALDLIAMLDEETDYLQQVYCKSPEELFDVPRILNFVEEHRKGNGQKNAMMLFIQYFEEYGGCR